MNNSLGVTIRAKVMPTFLKFFLKLTIVIDFSIEDDKDTLIFVENGLMTTCQVDNREATHPQRDSITYPGPLIIWSSVTNSLAHAINKVLCAILTALYINKTNYTAHKHPSFQ